MPTRLSRGSRRGHHLECPPGGRSRALRWPPCLLWSRRWSPRSRSCSSTTGSRATPLARTTEWREQLADVRINAALARLERREARQPATRRESRRGTSTRRLARRRRAPARSCTTTTDGALGQRGRHDVPPGRAPARATRRDDAAFDRILQTRARPPSPSSRPAVSGDERSLLRLETLPRRAAARALRRRRLRPPARAPASSRGSPTSTRAILDSVGEGIVTIDRDGTDHLRQPRRARDPPDAASSLGSSIARAAPNSPTMATIADGRVRHEQNEVVERPDGTLRDARLHGQPGLRGRPHRRRDGRLPRRHARASAPRAAPRPSTPPRACSPRRPASTRRRRGSPARSATALGWEVGAVWLVDGSRLHMQAMWSPHEETLDRDPRRRAATR